MKLQKTSDEMNVWKPYSPDDHKTAAQYTRFTVVDCKVSNPRNIKFHRKFFALVNIAFQHFEPQPIHHKGLTIGKNFDRFRKDLLILSGHYEIVVNIKGELRYQAKSISFNSINEEQFNQLYNVMINVILERIMPGTDRNDLENHVASIISF